MRLTSSCTSTCCANICQRVSYGEERRNISMARSTLGPFPDEWLLSGLDKILYFCGIKNICELVDKFPLNSDFYLSSSNSGSETCVTLSQKDCLKGCEDRITACYVKKCGNKEMKKEIEGPKCDPESSSVLERNSSEALKQSPSDILKISNKTSCALLNEIKKDAGGIAAPRDHPNPHSHCELSSSAEKSTCDKNIANCQSIVGSKSCEKGSTKSSQPFKLQTILCDSMLPLLGTGAVETFKKAYNDQLGKKPVKSQGCCQMSLKGTRVAASSRLQNIKLPRIIGTKWAMARINIFSDCSRTYEILEIKGRLPQAVIPCKTVVFFAVLPDGSTICYDYVKASKRSK